MGELSPSRSSVRGRTVGDALRAVGQRLAGMGLPDPRLNTSGKLDFRLTRQLAKYAKDDDPPNRVKPLPVYILRQEVQTAPSSSSDSFFSSGQENTQPPSSQRRPSAWQTSSSSTIRNPCRRQPCGKGHPYQISSASPSRNKKTESEVRWSAWDHPAMSPFALSTQYTTESNTSSNWVRLQPPRFSLTT
jgi:hypothetical protein